MDNYLKQTPYSDPGSLDLRGLPDDPGRLAGIVRDAVVHRGEGGRFGYDIPEQRLRDDAESRYVTEMLRVLRERSDRPLTEPRTPEERFVGTCRDFALLHCSLLRATGTPARLRCGFATYFGEDGFHDDHWVVEYLAEDGAVRLADPQVHHGYDMTFDPLDVPRDRFLVAPQAWRMCRDGSADPRTFGVRGLGSAGLSYTGLWFVRADVRRDLAALGGVEVLPWDEWGPELADDASLTEAELALVDTVATTADEGALRRLFEDPRLAVPEEITSYTTYDGIRKVRLSAPPA
ncbi:MAG: transglutaminase domain-containing protein [Streptomyces sp.]|uniref:transglutaminase-like domain-containing protein n=1 Tax=Streptomyces sp. TaxID=1931 RepID=UPI0025F571D7|nr:transglutaminase domain-containing protein [Streptomyces sp.]MBW8794641.1 transglutaminase domain-containing protein [Streptomyces sp.]